MSTGERIRAARKAANISQGELGQRMARARTYAAVSDIERDKTRLTVADLLDIAGILDVSPASLLPAVDDNAPYVTQNLPTRPHMPEDRVQELLSYALDPGGPNWAWTPELRKEFQCGDVTTLIANLQDARAALATLRATHAEVLGTLDWYEAIAHTARLMLQRAWDDPVQQELRELLADELANLAEVQS